MRRSIIVLVSSTQRRGAEVFGEHLATALCEAGWDTDFLALARIEATAQVTAKPILDAGPTSGLRPGVVRGLRNAVAELRPSILLAGGGATLKYSVAATRGMRARPLLVYSSIGEPDYWADNPARRWMMKTLLGRVDMVTAVSRATADQLVTGFGVGEEKVRVVHPGVPEDYLEIKPSPSGDELRVLFLGSLSAEKDPLAAVAAVQRMRAPATLRLVGSGPLIDQIREADGVEVVGSVADVRPHLSWADVLVLTSKTEGLPGVILEASAAGVPVVSYDVGGVAEAVNSGSTGLVVPAGDVDAIAASLDRLAGDRATLSRMGEAARDAISAHFLLDQAVGRYVEALETLTSH